MQIERTALTDAASKRPFCALECDGCTGMCLALYMMLNRNEQDEMCRRYKARTAPRVH
ncbi:hypothetical protein [uncultured Tateyamaria sp.]|uniref:hypothetical protein n=1 Tax=uncultured Tateyamaria sp. TaxID=455651 RepID=UPI0026078623|nr:hypothetical protein [uncultured Tateyamaria sp.]